MSGSGSFPYGTNQLSINSIHFLKLKRSPFLFFYLLPPFSRKSIESFFDENIISSIDFDLILIFRGYLDGFSGGYPKGRRRTLMGLPQEFGP